MGDGGDFPDDDLAEAAEPGPSLGDDLRQLIDDGRALAQAEVAWQKARAAYAASSAGGIALLGALGLALALFALLALTVGLLLALTPVLSAWGATAAVAGGLLLAAMLCAAAAALQARRVSRLIADRRERP